MALAAVLLLSVAGCSSDGEREPAPTAGDEGQSTTAATPSPEDSEGTAKPDQPGNTGAAAGSGSPAPVTEEVTQEAEEGIEDDAADVGDALEDPPVAEELSRDAVTGAALEDLRNRVAEYENSGWRVVGEPTVARHRVVRYSTNPESAVVRVCIDNSDIRVVDAAGRTVPGSRPANPRSLNILTLVKVGGAWAVSEQRLATRPDC